MKIIIAGSREFNDYKLFKRICDREIKQSDTIVSGCARGADTLAIHYAKERKLNLLKFYADWDKYGKRAGYLRNIKMAENSDCLIAFWDGKSKGTEHMINIAHDLKLKVMVVKYNQEIIK